jgi:hypothetical protein
MNITWILPDHTIRVTSAKHIDKLLFTLEVVDSVSLEGSSYRVVKKELTVEEERCVVTISLAHQMPESDVTVSSCNF